MKNTPASIKPEVIIDIARAIGRCDFRTSVSLYTTSTSSPWVITVGESSWHRHMIVESTSVGLGGADATLAILAQSESGKFGYDIDIRNIEKRIELTELLAGRYIGVKKALFPSKTASLEMIRDNRGEKCRGYDLRGCPFGGTAAWSGFSNRTWKGPNSKVSVAVCDKCADQLRKSS